MRFLERPNLPSSRVKLVIIDSRVHKDMIENLNKLDIDLIFIEKNITLYNAISSHPDMLINHVGKNIFVCEPTINRKTIEELESYGAKIILGRTKLKKTYPYNIAYNLAVVGEYAIHNFSYTDEIILNEIKGLKYKLINVRQGYTKCMITVIDENSIITSDRGIYKECKKSGLDVLLIQEKEQISLFEIKNGFIGGSTGKISERDLAITGDFNNLKSANLLKNFLNKRNINIISLSKGEIIDFGSIIPIMEK